MDREGRQGIRRECLEEESFYEMYEASGDTDRQAEIRELNPDKKHCLDLKVSPNACMDCKNNFLKDKAPDDIKMEREILEENIPCLEHTLALNDYVGMGMANDLREISPDEAFALRLTWQQIRARERAEDVEMMASILGPGLLSGRRK